MALAAVAAAALVLACAAPGEAQTAKKAKKKAPQPEQAQQGEQPNAPEKKKKLTAAEAQQAVDAALKLLEAGKAEQAVQALTSTLAAGRLPPATMAKALLYRGIAYRQQKQPAQAIADLTSALWLKGGLGETERKDALGQRAAAYQEAGLTESGEAIAAAVPQTPRASTRAASTLVTTTTTAPTPPPSTSLAAAPAPAAEKQKSGGWNPFGGLFGGPASTPAPPQSSAPAPQSTASILRTDSEPAPVPNTEPRPKSARSAWTRNTEVHGGPAPTETAALPAKPEGKFRVQVGMVRTQDQAQALAGKVKTQYAAALGQRDPQIDEAVVGNMGSFYRVRVGPFASQQEGQAACAKLKGSGLDCLVVAQ